MFTMHIHILKLLVPYFFLSSTANARLASLAFGGDESLAMENKKEMMTASKNLHKRRYLSGEELFSTASEVMIKNLDCSACMEAYPSGNDGPGQSLRNRDLATTDEVFVTALNCDAGNPLQIWNLTALDEAGTWNLFKNVETESCMQLFGECSFDGRLYTIKMGECDSSNPKAIWGVTGMGQIVNFNCFVNGYHSHSTPDVFLKAKCGADGGRHTLDISSLDSGSEDTASNSWAVFPKDLLSVDNCSECGNCGAYSLEEYRAGCTCDVCESIVCAEDPYCCDFNWDGLCVDMAYDLCDICSLMTSSPGPVPQGEECFECGTCDVSRPSEVGCSCAFCESIVCTEDPYCCYFEWDGICVAAALDACDSCTA